MFHCSCKIVCKPMLTSQVFYIFQDTVLTATNIGDHLCTLYAMLHHYFQKRNFFVLHVIK